MAYNKGEWKKFVMVMLTQWPFKLYSLHDIDASIFEKSIQ
jgi:hypothetical protein